MFLQAVNIYKDYQAGERVIHALQENSIKIEEGIFYAVTGRSGSGKTTLLHLLSTLESATGGEIYFEGMSISKMNYNERARVRRKKIGIIFQEYYLLPELSAYENMILPVLIDKKEIDKLYLGEIIKILEIESFLEAYPHQLSGGEIQRIAIARALANKPKLLFADEPTGQLDEKTSFHVMELLQECHQKYGQTIIMVTHDKSMAQYADKILKLSDGKLICD